MQAGVRDVGRSGKADGQECDGAEGPGREHQDSHRSFVGHQRGGAGAGAGRSPGPRFCGVPADPLQQAVVHLADIVKANYRTLAHASWGAAGAPDCLRRGQIAAARARLNILLLQLDQSACDKGSWTFDIGAQCGEPSALHQLDAT